MALFQTFAEDYKKNLHHFEKIAQICAQQCESGLKRRGLRVLVTSRAKRLDSLIQKVENRAKHKKYKSIEEIYADIVDLAGVRIALYFPGDRDEVDAFLKSNFNVDRIKDFPQDTPDHPEYQKRFSGYAARHYRLFLRKENLKPSEKHLANKVIEVQVGSVLMHAWSEVEHDLVYKSTIGPLSRDEYAILDELNGLMHAGEIALERLQWAVKRRISTESQPFSNHYELSSYLYDYAQSVSRETSQEPFIGRTDVLFHFLKTINLDSVPSLEPILRDCNVDLTMQPLAQQIVDHILQDDPDLYQAYNNARLAVGRTDPFGAPHESLSYFSEKKNLGAFMRQWIASERLIEDIMANVLIDDKVPLPFDVETIRKIKHIKALRNDILYGDRWPSEQEIIKAGEFLQKLVELFRQENRDFTPTKEDLPRKEA